MGEEVVGVGVCPVGCRLTLPLWCPAGWCAFFVAGAPCLQLTFFPPSPLPPLPGGKGEIFCFLMQGASPLASPGLSRKRHWDRGGEPRTRRGGWLSRLPADLAAVVPGGGRALFVARLPCLWFTFLPPIPPAPFPGGEGGDFLFSYARGFAPCIPGTEPEATREQGTNHAPGGGLAFPVAG